MVDGKKMACRIVQNEHVTECGFNFGLVWKSEKKVASNHPGVQLPPSFEGIPGAIGVNGQPNQQISQDHLRETETARIRLVSTGKIMCIP